MVLSCCVGREGKQFELPLRYKWVAGHEKNSLAILSVDAADKVRKSGPTVSSGNHEPSLM